MFTIIQKIMTNPFVQKATILSVFFLLTFLSAKSQEVPFYRAEIGIQLGGNIYAGDANTIARKNFFSQNLNNLQADFGAFFRYKFNPRVALRLGYDYTGVSGPYKYANAGEEYVISLDNKGIGALDLWAEYNFFDYEKNNYKRTSRTFSPYVFAGLGYLNMANSQAEKASAFTVPYGVGVKIIIAPRWNLNLQWTNRLLLADNLEGLPEYDNPLPQTKSNFLNHDLLSGVSVGVSFDIWQKECDCNGVGGGGIRAKSKRPLNNSKPKR